MLHRQRGRLGGQRRNLLRNQRAGFGQRNHAEKFYERPGKMRALRCKYPADFHDRRVTAKF